MLKVGLTGGLGCGKTFVATELERLGCHLIHADLLGHQVLAKGGPGYGPVVDVFGPTILDRGGQINRARLAAIVFEDPLKLAALNSIVHPAVRRLEDELFANIASREPRAIAVFEAAILVENGSYKDYDKLIVVWCEPALQIKRAVTRDAGADRAIVLARLARQMPILEKRHYADYQIDSNGTEDETLRQTREVFRALVTIEKGI